MEFERDFEREFEKDSMDPIRLKCEFVGPIYIIEVEPPRWSGACKGSRFWCFGASKPVT